jgi:DMSO reductase anchor subunit
MHPALSVIVFTVATGIGYGMLFWLPLNVAMGFGLDRVGEPAKHTLGIVAFGLAFAIVGIGLIASTFHLGHPERAWRALSQWRSSWLSREGAAALFTFIPTGIFAIGWTLFERVDGWWLAAGLSGALCSLITVFCTAMIYASLKPIRNWNTPGVPLIYLFLSVASGAVWLTAVGRLCGVGSFSDLMAGFLVLLAAFLKLRYWRWIDGKSDAFEMREPNPTTANAIGLKHDSKVRPLDPPHTEQNYLMKEMGFVIARRHARKLRAIALGLFMLAAMAAFLSFGGALLNTVAALVAALAMVPALLIERWLFFAEAKHTVMLYYRGDISR